MEIKHYKFLRCPKSNFKRKADGNKCLHHILEKCAWTKRPLFSKMWVKFQLVNTRFMGIEEVSISWKTFKSKLQAVFK